MKGVEVIRSGLSPVEADARYVRPNVLAVPNVYANGFRFPAVAVASADPNTLDDYERGTWVPTLPVPGYLTVFSARYVKVGRLVTVSFAGYLDPVASAVAATFGGLPFPRGSSESLGGSIAFFPGAAPVPFVVPTSVGTTSFGFYDGAGVQLTLTDLSDCTFNGVLSYLGA